MKAVLWQLITILNYDYSKFMQFLNQLSISFLSISLGLFSSLSLSSPLIASLLKYVMFKSATLAHYQLHAGFQTGFHSMRLEIVGRESSHC